MCWILLPSEIFLKRLYYDSTLRQKLLCGQNDMEATARNKSDVSEANMPVFARAFPATADRGIRKHSPLKLAEFFFFFLFKVISKTMMRIHGALDLIKYKSFLLCGLRGEWTGNSCLLNAGRWRTRWSHEIVLTHRMKDALKIIYLRLSLKRFNQWLKINWLITWRPKRPKVLSSNQCGFMKIRFCKFNLISLFEKVCAILDK